MKFEIVWHWLVFIAALIALGTLVLELFFELSESETHIIELLDISIIAIFAADVSLEYHRFHGSKTKFFKQHWLEILAIIPIFRVIRISKLAKLEKLAKLDEIVEIRRGIMAEETISKGIHAKHLKDIKKDKHV